MSLPKGFKRLEYIQSSGTQFINSGVICNASTYNRLRQIVVEKSAFAGWSVSGVGTAGNCWFTGATDTQIYYGSGNGNVATGVRLTANTKNEFDLDFPNNKYTVKNLDGGTTLVNLTSLTKGTPTSSYELRLFGYSGDNGNHAGMIYLARYYLDGAMIRDFIPCQNTSGAVGLWDDVEDKFYDNAGTGTFTAGPVISEAMDESDITELEYIQSSGTQHIKSGLTPNNQTDMEVDFYTTVAQDMGGIAWCETSFGKNMYGIDMIGSLFGTWFQEFS